MGNNEYLATSELNIENMIYEIRGKQVMLDSDLAKLYQCKNGTKEINQAVKNNPDKFPERFSWKLTNKESDTLLVKIFDQKGKLDTRGGKYRNPRVFTEQGVAMLATILKTDVAVQTSIKIMDAFVSMRKYLSSSLLNAEIMAYQVINNSKDIFEIKNSINENRVEIRLLQESFKKFEEKKVVNEIYFNGQIYDAYSKILDIFKESKKDIIVIDGYADKVFLDIARSVETNIILITFTKNSRFQSFFSKYSKQYSNLKVIYNNSFHDRYFILDQSTVYHCGTSINHAGSKTFSINKIEDKIVIDSLIDCIKHLV